MLRCTCGLHVYRGHSNISSLSLAWKSWCTIALSKDFIIITNLQLSIIIVVEKKERRSAAIVQLYVTRAIYFICYGMSLHMRSKLGMIFFYGLLLAISINLCFHIDVNNICCIYLFRVDSECNIMYASIENVHDVSWYIKKNLRLKQTPVPHLKCASRSTYFSIPGSSQRSANERLTVGDYPRGVSPPCLAAGRKEFIIFLATCAILFSYVCTSSFYIEYLNLSIPLGKPEGSRGSVWSFGMTKLFERNENGIIRGWLDDMLWQGHCLRRILLASPTNGNTEKIRQAVHDCW